MKKNRFLNKTAGFSLVEMMIALALILIVSASLVPLMVFVTKSGHNSQSKKTADTLATSVMEKIRAMDYNRVGTINGNPPGDIPQLQENVAFNGEKFDVETLISWGSIEESENTDAFAYKNVRIMVNGYNRFSENRETLAELHSIVSRDGEESMVLNGHIRAMVRDATNTPMNDPLVHVEITSPISQAKLTDYNGVALFGILDAGIYHVRAKVEDELLPSPKETVTNGWIERDHIEVEDDKVTDVVFYMEKKTNACFLEIKLIDKDTHTVITENGKASLYLTLDDGAYPICEEKEFTVMDFEGDCLPADFFGELWPEGIYNIQIDEVDGYRDYDFSIHQDAFLSNQSALWNGKFNEPGTALQVTIPMDSNNFYQEETQDDFEDNISMENLVATDHNTLEMEYYSGVVPPDLILDPQASSSNGNRDPSNAFDGQIGQNSSWQSGDSPNNEPQWIRCELDTDTMLTGVRVYLSHNENNPGSDPNHKPKDFEVRVSMDGENWDVAASGTFPNDQLYYILDFTSPIACRFFELYITSKHSSNPQGIRIHEIELLHGSGRVESGERLSRPIPLAYCRSDMRLYIEWDADVPDDTTFEVWTLVTEGNDQIPTEGFTKVENGDMVPDIGYLENLENKYLWIKEKFATSDTSKTPVLNWLKVIEKGLGES